MLISITGSVLLKSSLRVTVSVRRCLKGVRAADVAPPGARALPAQRASRSRAAGGAHVQPLGGAEAGVDPGGER